MKRNLTVFIILLTTACYSFAQADTVLYQDLSLHTNYKGTGNGYYFLNDKPYTGVAVEYYENGKMHRLMHMEMGMMHGAYYQWHADGQLRMEQHYFRGLRHGKYIYYYKNGALQSMANMFMGMPYDTTKKWFPDSTLQHMEYVALGDSIVRCYDQYYESGIKRLEVRPDHKKQWYETGMLEFEESYKDDKKDGVCIYYNTAGDWYKKTWWEKGKFIKAKTRNKYTP